MNDRQAHMSQSPRNLVIETADDFRVHTSAYTDPDIFEEEMRRIFENTWVYVAHASELPVPGAFRTSMVGQNPVIVTRTDEGEIRVLLNACRHRGNAVCRETRGVARTFTCPYHGWVYSNTGDLKGVTHANGYPASFAADLGGLIRLRAAMYRGLIFASINDDVPSIEDHLGDVRKYIDLWADLSPEREFKVAHPHHYAYQGNWKFQPENGIDGWHARFVHSSAFDTIQEFGGRPASDWATIGCTRGFDGGFGILERQGIQQGLSIEERDQYKELISRRHASERVGLIWQIRHIYIFPNVLLFDNLIRVIQPVAVENTHVISYPLMLNGAPESFNKARLFELQMRLGTTGMVNADDLEMFASNQTGMRGGKLEWVVLSHGMARDKRLAGSEMQGEDTSELPQRSIYRQWAKFMNAGSVPPVGGYLP